MGRHEFMLVAALVLVFILATSLRPPMRQASPAAASWGWEDFMLYIAEGFGVGRIPFTPGTFGSLLGLLWFGLLLASGRWWVFAGGMLAGLGLSVWLCGLAEDMLHQKDPGSVVLDEITAMPVCFSGWVGILLAKNGALPVFDDFFSERSGPLALGVFVAFRFFDIAKPWPVRQSQALPGGWGVTIDDVLAAVYVNALVLLVYAGANWLGW
jgi:phosphatidylglycerophosphatase A